MLCSILRTFACVLIIQGGIYALRLNGPGGSGSSAGAGGASSIGVGGGANAPTNLGGGTQHNTAANSNQIFNILSATQHAQHLHAGGSGGVGGGGGGSGSLAHTFSKSMVGQLDSAGRLSQELADMAQLERERLMLLGLAKQTAAASAGTGHHGRPIITGRIQMSPVEEVESDYPALLLQQARGPMYGSIVKQPAAVEDEYIDEEGEYGARRRPEKYEYGRVVQPSDREEHGQPQRGDELDELIEAEPELDDMLTDLDSYQYLDELLPPEHRSMWGDDSPAYAVAGGNTRPHHLNDGLPLLLNPYRTLEELEESAPHTLQEIFEKEQHSGGLKEHRAQQVQQQAHEQQQPHQKHYQPQQLQHSYSGGIQHRNGGYVGSGVGGAAGFNTRLQQKWQRKRSQQQQQQRQLQQWQRNIFGQQRQQLHHFGTNSERHNKLTFANSEATAAKHIQPNNSNDNKLPSALIAMAPQQKSSSTTLLSAVSGANSKSEQQPQQELKQPPMQQQVGKENVDDSASSTAALAKAAAKLKTQQQTQQQQQQQLHKQQQTPTQKQESFLHPNHKRSGSIGAGGGGAGNSMSAAAAAAAAAANNGYSSIASQLMLRTARGQRQYDVPQIECPAAMDGMERFACPTPDLQGRYRCIDDHVLCDGFIDCPEGEDEDRRSCMFYKTVKAHLDVLADALLRWARGR